MPDRDRRFLKIIAVMGGCAAVSICALGAFKAVAQSQSAGSSAAAPANSGDAAPIYGVRIPPGYRDWKLISVTHETGSFNQLRAQLGNDIAIKAFREGAPVFPDGSIIVALHWTRVPSDEDNKVFGQEQAFVAQLPVNMQVMVKDSKKYAASGGWGYGDFRDGKPSDLTVHQKCYACHIPAKDTDYVYTRYAP
jgi:hypothetical protein